MADNREIELRVEQLVTWYGDGADGSSPTPAQWRHLLERPSEAPATLVNFFKMRDRADYPQGSANAAAPGTGQEAFNRYAAVSMPALEKVGGRFAVVAPFEAMFLGENEDWDLVAVGSYPNSTAVLALYEDADYRAAFQHRTAACARQKVFVCSG